MSSNKANKISSRFKNTLNIEKIPESSNINSLKTIKKINKKHIINFGFLNSTTDLLNLTNAKSNNINHSKIISNKYDKKMNII